MQNLQPTTYNPHLSRGFTFVETLVAISILLLAVAGPLTLGSQGLNASRVARDQVIATFLGQEAIEYARNIRDTNALQGEVWLEGLDACTGACTVDVPQNTIAMCTGTCPALRFDAEVGLYGYESDWLPTKFTRSVTITETVAGREAHIIVATSWNDGKLTRSVTVNEYLFNWE